MILEFWNALEGPYVSSTKIFPSILPPPPPPSKPSREKSISSKTSKSSSVSDTSTTCRLSWTNIVKNIDKAPLPKCTVILEEEINKEIEEDTKNTTFMNNKESSLTSSKSSNKYFSFASEVISLTTIHLSDESSETNDMNFLMILMALEATIQSNKVNCTFKYIQKKQLIKNIRMIQRECIKLLFQCNNEQALHKMKNKKIMKVNAQRKTIGPATYDQDQEKFHQHKEKQACLKEFMEKMDDLFEEVRMDIETEDK